MFTNRNIKTRLNFPELLVNYSRDNYFGDIIYRIVLKNKFKKCKHVYSKVSITSKQL